MNHSLLKIILCFIIISACSISTSAQVYLDYAKIHVNLTPIGAYDINQTPNGDYYVVDNYVSYQSDMDPDEDNKVQVHASNLSPGLYLAKYDKDGKYLNHTYIKGGTARNQLTRVISNDSFVVLMCQGYDSVVFGGVDGFRLSSPGYATYIVKYNHNLKIVESLVLKNDSVFYGNILFGSKGNLLIYGSNNGKLNLDINGTEVQISAKFGPQLYNIFLLGLSPSLQYENHFTLGIPSAIYLNQICSDENGQIYLSGNGSFYGNSTILGDTIPKSLPDVGGFRSSALVLKLNSNLTLVNYYASDLRDVTNLIPNPNGDVLLDATGLLLQLDSNFKEKSRYAAYGSGGGTGNFSKSFGFVAKGNNYGIVANFQRVVFQDSTHFLDGPSVLVLSQDSLKLISLDPVNKHIKQVYHADSTNILSVVQFNGGIDLQKSMNDGPPFFIGDPLYPTIQHTAIVNHRYDCTPVTTYLQYDSQVNCADQYSMYAGRGNIRLIPQGSGAAFQWYNASNPTFKLGDQESPLQGGISWRGMKSSYYKFSVGTSNFLSNQLIAKVGGSCTAPYWSDTGTQIIWGAPRMIATESSKNVTQGGSDSIEAYLDDKNYPLDSLEIQWYRGGTALIDGLRFHGARTQKLYINNIKDFDQGLFTCVATRIHCRDFNAVLGSSTYVNVKITGVKDIKNSAISIYPNPTRSLLNIQSDLTSKIQQIEVYDAVGKLQFKLFGDITQVDVSKLNTGIFILKIMTENQVFSTQFIKN